MKRVVGLLGVMLGFWVAASATAEEFDWSSDSCRPLALARSSISHPLVPAGLKVEDLTYAACDGKTITAYLISPPDVKPNQHPAILYVHWFDPHVKNSNREEFVSEAVEFAKKGGVALLVSTFWSVPGGYYDQRRWQDDVTNTLNQVRDLRRALQLFREQPGVAKNSMAYVGHDYGAVFGAIMAPLEPQLKTWVLAAATGEISHWYLYGSASGVPEKSDLANYRKSFQLLEPNVRLQKAHVPVLLQFAEKDEYIDDKQRQSLQAVAPVASETKLYATDHAMELPQVRIDRELWLEQRLGMKKLETKK